MTTLMRGHRLAAEPVANVSPSVPGHPDRPGGAVGSRLSIDAYMRFPVVNDSAVPAEVRRHMRGSIESFPRVTRRVFSQPSKKIAIVQQGERRSSQEQRIRLTHQNPRRRPL